MSGGYFDYRDGAIDDVARSIDRLVKIYNDSTPVTENSSWTEKFVSSLTPETIQEFKNAVKLLRVASLYAHRIDYLMEGDDGEETFHKRLKKDLQMLEEDLA